MTLSAVDMRGRLWVKYVLNRALSWTTRVEFNIKWGDEDHGGGIGTDGTDFLRWKHTYVDWTTEPMDGLDLNFRIGLQDVSVARGYLFDDDFAGLKLWYQGDNFILPLVWMKAHEGYSIAGDDLDADDALEAKDEFDVDFIGLNPKFFFDDFTVNPFVFYLMSDDAHYWDATTGNTELSVAYLGLDLDYAPDWGHLWLDGIYSFGTADTIVEDIDFDIASFLVGGGVELFLDDFGVHGQAFYASGDDDLEDEDMTAFIVPQGQFYTWSEIMGEGVFDSYGASNGSPGTALTNIWAANLGASFQATDTLKLTGDLWYAELVEENELIEDKELGTEANLALDWAVNPDMNLTLVGAYLFAGDATTMGAEEEADPWEVGLQLSFRFTTE